MKYCILILILLFSLTCFADIGPSPSYSFTISNTADYSNYKFYYAGNIWDDKFEQITDSTNVYKLNTHITIYAIPKEFIGKENSKDALNQSIKSQKIDLKSGHSVFKISSMNKENKSMQLIEENNTSDLEPVDQNFLSAIIPILIFIVIPLVVLILIIKFLIKKLNKK